MENAHHMTAGMQGFGTRAGRRRLAPGWPRLAGLVLLLLHAPTAGASRRSSAPAPETTSDASTALPVQGANALQYFDFHAKDGTTTLGLTAAMPVLYNTSYETNATTLIVEVPGAEASQLQPVASIGTPEVDEVRITQLQPGGQPVTRFEIKKSASAHARVQADPKDPKRLEIVVTADDAAAPAEQPPAPAEPSSSALLASPPSSEAPAPTLRVPDFTSRPAADLSEPQTLPGRSQGRLIDARVERTDDGRLAVRLSGDRALSATSFILDKPLRLCVDLLGVVDETHALSIPVRDAAVLKVRIGQNTPLPDPVTRVVIELRENVPHELVSGPSSLAILLGRAQARPMAVADASAAGSSAEPDLLSLPDGMSPSTPLAPPMRETAAPGSMAAMAAATDSSARFDTVEVTDHKKEYTGEPISISMKDADLQDVFRLFHQFSNMNIVVDQSVKGKTITLELRDVPWDQALALVLQTNGLGQVLDGNVLRIAPLAKLSSEEKAQREFDDARELSGNLESVAIPLSYATVAQAEALVKKSLSSRGDVSSDKRTNTLFIKDLKKYLDDAKALIALLDTPTRLVQIEARIVETTVDFAKATGIRWGFGYIADRAFGNSTGFAFPRSVTTDYAVNLPGSGSNSTLGLSFRNILNTFALDISLDALESHGKTRVISRPLVVVQNNQKATISSGFSIPITNTTATETDVTFVPAQLSLDVTPQITADNNVIMDVKVNNDSPGFLVGDNPSISTRQAQTVVAVPDGGTTVIGGIYQVNEGVSSARTPFLSRIPLLGWLFRNKNVSRTNDELLVFVTPRIVKNY
jgi:type IV pilus assembly protein PilQ